ncbi:MAG: sugar phosphate nucleotidyltransferase [Acidimicrobiales bacterium]
MDALIMAGGQGTRLQPLTFSLPKPLMPVGNRPILEIILNQLRRGGFERVFVSVGYKGNLVQAYLRETPVPGLHIEYILEEAPLGTAGPLVLLPADVEALFMINGDILTEVDFRAVLKGHTDQTDAAITVVAHNHAITLPYGVLQLDGDKVTGIDEKPTLHLPVATGMYALDRRAIDRLPAGRSDMPGLISMLGAEGKVRTHLTEAFWTDVADLVDYERIHVDAARWADL